MPTHSDSTEPEKIPDEHSFILGLADLLQVRFESYSFFLAGIFFLLFFTVLYYTRELVLPLVIAVLFDFLLNPAVQFLKKKHVPGSIGAFIIILLCLFIVGLGVFGLAEPTSAWINKSPEAISTVNAKLTAIQNYLVPPGSTLSKMNEKIKQSPISKGPSEIPAKTTELLGSVVFKTGSIIIEFSITLFVLYFLLTSEDFFLRKLLHWSDRDKRKDLILIFSKVRYSIWKYLFARTMVNLGLGIATTLVMFILGMPNPILWGVMAGLLDYIPYVGPLISLAVIWLVAIFSFTSFGYASLVALIFLIILIVEGNIVTPIVIGRTLTLKPLVAFLALLFWGWIWGIVGMFLAIPVTAVIKIIFETYYESSFMKELLS